MGSDEKESMSYFKKIKIVPVSLSYEYDPTDALKMPQLLAEAKKEIYIKEKNEDFITLLSGIIGQKKRIHIHIGDVFDSVIDDIIKTEQNPNKQIQLLTQKIDDSILQSYKLWPTNYIAYDMLYETNQFENQYTVEEKQLFQRRLELRIDENSTVLREGFLAMYANPVVNKLKYNNATI